MDDTNTQPVAGSNKKIFYIIGGLVVLGLVGGMMSRGAGYMGMGGPAGYMGMKAAGVDVQPGPGGAATYSNNEGSVTVGGNKMPDNWPSDAPSNFAGASIQYSGSSNPQTGQAGSALVYTVKASADAVAAQYKSELNAKGWTIESTANVAGATVISAQKDTRTFGAYISSTEDGNVTVQASISM